MKDQRITGTGGADYNDEYGIDAGDRSSEEDIISEAYKAADDRDGDDDDVDEDDNEDDEDYNEHDEDDIGPPRCGR